MSMEKSDLTSRAEEILKSCADNYTRISCNVIDPRFRDVPLPYVLTCYVEGSSATVDWDRLLEKANGNKDVFGAMEATIGGEKHRMPARIIVANEFDSG